jgi:erythronate-4-phosphate dehydrogenase
MSEQGRFRKMQFPLRVLADINIPGLERWNSDFVELSLMDGRNISRSDLLDADALLVRSITRVNQELLQGSRVSFVGTATSGVDHVDIPWLQDQGIQFADAAGANANAVAEYVIAVLAALIEEKNFDPWQAKVAVVGVGQVGSALVRRLKLMGIDCVGCDPLRQDISDLEYINLEQALKADVICLHTPLTIGGEFSSYHMIGAAQFEHMQKSAVLINAGRGEVIDTPALITHLEKNPDFIAVLDVWENEPQPSAGLLQAVDILTPHIAGYSLEAKLTATQRVVDALCACYGIERPVICVSQAMAAEPERSLSLCSKNQEFDTDRKKFANHVLGVLSPLELSRDFKSSASKTGSAYDKMRVEMSMRREFSSCNVNPLDTSSRLAHWLQGAGFALQT